MKKTILLLFSILLCSSAFAQNSCCDSSTTRYIPEDMAYYGRLAKQSETAAVNKAQYISDFSKGLKENAEGYLKSTKDASFKAELEQVVAFLDVISGNDAISISTAQWYLDSASKRFNKAVKDYNKRLRKVKNIIIGGPSKTDVE